jgi:hypothetical protein
METLIAGTAADGKAEPNPARRLTPMPAEPV